MAIPQVLDRSLLKAVWSVGNNRRVACRQSLQNGDSHPLSRGGGNENVCFTHENVPLDVVRYFAQKASSRVHPKPHRQILEPFSLGAVADNCQGADATVLGGQRKRL